MSDRGKLNLEELKKSFPSLDDHSTKTLLGGNVEPTFESSGEFVYSQPGGSPGSTPYSGPPSGGNSPSASSGGSDYFGINEPTLVSSDDFGWGGWGDGGVDSGSGGESNPSGGDGGNGQSSSGDPGGEQRPPLPWQGPEPTRTNISSYQDSSYDIINNSSSPVMVQYGPYGTTPHIVPSGGSFSTPFGWDMGIDGININGYTFKVPNGFNFIRINDFGWSTNYWFPLTNGNYEDNGGLLEELPPDNAGNPDQNWHQILYWSP